MSKLPKSLIVLLAGTISLLLFALYNGYPMVSGDTMIYINSGYELKAAAERPIFYGMFIRLSSLGFSIWLTLFTQCLILAYLLIQFIKFIIPTIPALHLLSIMLLISTGTICSWYAGSLMPDIFTPILGLALFNYIFIKNTKSQKMLLLSIITIATLVHFSHYIIFTIFSISFLLFIILFKKHRIHLYKSIILIFICLTSWLALMSSNYLSGSGFVSSSASPVFLMGKLSESGVLKTYLEKACPIKDYKICHHKDELPSSAWGFVWDDRYYIKSDSVSAAESLKEYKTIIADICSRPKYWVFMAYKSLEATARQVILTNIDEGEERPWIKYESDHPLFKEIGKRFPHEINLFENARQNNKTLNYTFYDEVYVVIMVLSILLVLFLMRPEMKNIALPVYLFFIAYILLNAFATATFANVLSRLNSRNIWLLPMVNLVFIYALLSQRKFNKKAE